MEGGSCVCVVQKIVFRFSGTFCEKFCAKTPAYNNGYKERLHCEFAEQQLFFASTLFVVTKRVESFIGNS